ncbi:hypothetical protein M438DRAFT_6926 [Aureobasidium pullulans EXF-150]|uniref:Uncharacterized protein n=1 Tax=Aureobasidium pullulans EXF-150 TaxID=1043002 RepID=A0A074Y5J3_AURPU|nr:uncharacterized protein M438DRAFT_6926 [Aureobasidium pullulans EXF-150]KEQ89467.1 hypothetical protein M438DRAFT_6926 [Aureobasidium pullulans EXF-150]
MSGAREDISSFRKLVFFFLPVNTTHNMSLSSGAPPIISGPTILDLQVAHAQAALSSAGAWSSNDLTRLCKVHGIYSGSIDHSKLLLVMLKKTLTQPVVYEGFGLPDLITFIKARGLGVDQTIRDAVEAAEKSLEASARHQADPQQESSSSTPSLLCAEFDAENVQMTEGTAHNIASVDTLPSSYDGWSVFDFVPYHGQQHLPVDQVIAPEPCQHTDDLIRVLEVADREREFDFLALPADMRQMVYHYVCRASLTVLHPQRQPAITRVCRQTRTEALPVYYGNNRFAVAVSQHRGSPYNHWMRCIESPCLARIRSFAFVELFRQKVIEIDFTPHGKIHYHVKMRGLPSKSILDERWRQSSRTGGHRMGGCLRPSPCEETIKDLDNDGRNLILGKPVRYTEDYLGFDHQTEALIQKIVEREASVLESKMAAHAGSEYHKSLGHDAFLTPWLSVKDWILLKEEWNRAEGFSIVGLRALSYAFGSTEFWE